MTDKELVRARHRVRELRGFYVHLAIYVAVIAGIAAINWITSPNNWWVVWPMVIWGIGIAAHAISIYFEAGILGPEWEERKTRELLDKSHRPDPISR